MRNEHPPRLFSNTLANRSHLGQHFLFGIDKHGDTICQVDEMAVQGDGMSAEGFPRPSLPVHMMITDQFADRRQGRKRLEEQVSHLPVIRTRLDLKLDQSPALRPGEDANIVYGSGEGQQFLLRDRERQCLRQPADNVRDTGMVVSQIRVNHINRF
jgi:hypothetical protein